MNRFLVDTRSAASSWEISIKHAQLEGLTLVTVDARIERYDVATLRADAPPPEAVTVR